MAVRYWYLSGGTANWNTARWYTNPQLTGSPVTIATIDDAIVNQNSGPGTLNVSTSPTIKSLNLSGYTGGFTSSTTGIIMTINGGDGSVNNYSYVGSTSISSSVQIRLNATSSSTYKVIRNGMTINNSITVNPTVSNVIYNFDDYFETQSGITFTITTGRVNFNGDNGIYNATLGRLSSSNSNIRTVTCTGLSKLNLIGSATATGSTLTLFDTSTSTNLTVSINEIHVTSNGIGTLDIRTTTAVTLNDIYFNCTANVCGFGTPPVNVNNVYVTISTGTSFSISTNSIIRGNLDFTTSTGRWTSGSTRNLFLYGDLILSSGLTYQAPAAPNHINFVGNTNQNFYLNGTNGNIFSNNFLVTTSKNNTNFFIDDDINIGTLTLNNTIFNYNNSLTANTFTSNSSTINISDNSTFGTTTLSASTFNITGNSTYGTTTLSASTFNISGNSTYGTTNLFNSSFNSNGTSNFGITTLSASTLTTNNPLTLTSLNVYNGGDILLTNNSHILTVNGAINIFDRSDFFECPNLTFNNNMFVHSGGKFLNLGNVTQTGIVNINVSGITYFNTADGVINCRVLNVNGGEVYMPQSGSSNFSNITLQRVVNDPILNISNPLSNFNCGALQISAGTFTHAGTVITPNSGFIRGDGVLLNQGGLFNCGSNFTLSNNASISGINSTSTQFIFDTIQFNNQSSGYFSGNLICSGGTSSIDITGTTIQLDGFLNLGLSALELRSGTLISKGGARMGTFSATNTPSNKILDIESGTTWELSSIGNVWSINNPSAVTLNVTGSTLKITNGSNNQPLTFNGGAKTYGTLWINRINSSSPFYINGDNTFEEIRDGNEYTLSGSKLTNFNILSHTIFFEDGSTQTVDKFNVNGIPTARISLNSSGNTGSVPQFTIQKSTATETELTKCFYLNINRSQAIPVESIWFARGSIEGVPGSNSGWTISDERYWVTGGTKAWNSTSNWSLISGGPSGSTVPSNTVSAIFDTNSGNDVVIITGSATCFDFDVSNFTGTVSAFTTQNLTVWGDVVLGNSISGYTNRLQVQPRNNDIFIFSNGVQTNFLLDIYDIITPTTRRTVRLGDDYNSTNYIILRHHNFDTNTKNITVPSLITTSNPCELYLNNSLITLTGPGNPQASSNVWDMSNESIIVDAGTSEILITDTTNNEIGFTGGGFGYNKVRFERGNSSASTVIRQGTNVRVSGNSFNEFIFNTTEPHTILFQGTLSTGVTGVSIFNILDVNGFSNDKRITLDINGFDQYIFKSINPNKIKLNNVNVNYSLAELPGKFFANVKNSTIDVTTTNWSYYVDGKNLGLLGVG
jgi:hypothetical protein